MLFGFFFIFVLAFVVADGLQPQSLEAGPASSVS